MLNIIHITSAWISPSRLNLDFENDTLSITFQFLPKAIHFELYNKPEDGIKIMWDELSISENGIAQRVIHKNTAISRITDLQPPTSIPPKTKMEDNLVPEKNVKFARNYTGQYNMTLIYDLYPISDFGNSSVRKRIEKKKDQKIVIFFPYYIRNVYHSLNFEFFIVDVVRGKKKK